MHTNIFTKFDKDRTQTLWLREQKPCVRRRPARRRCSHNMSGFTNGRIKTAFLNQKVTIIIILSNSNTLPSNILCFEENIYMYDKQEGPKGPGCSPEEKVKGYSGAIYRGPLMLSTKYWKRTSRWCYTLHSPRLLPIPRWHRGWYCVIAVKRRVSHRASHSVTRGSRYWFTR